MRLLLKELWSFIKSDFNIWLFAFFFVFLFVAIKINYHYGIYWKLVNIQASGSVRFIRFFLLFSIPWFAVAMPKLVLSNNKHVLSNIRFYIAILLILGVIAFDSAFSIFKPMLKFAYTFDEQLYLTKIATNLQGIVIMLFFSLVIIQLIAKTTLADLGLRLKAVIFRTYFILILAIVPMIVWASFKPDFIATYPIYKPWDFPILLKMPKLVSAVIYEFFYGIDFITIEFAFRGLLVILMAKFIGKDAILPMAAVYCFLHFGKPEAEAISSIFGGYLLGFVALSTRSIAPGIILHLSLAYMMDIAAYIQHYLK